MMGVVTGLAVAAGVAAVAWLRSGAAWRRAERHLWHDGRDD
jgi:hypothetical protein